LTWDVTEILTAGQRSLVTDGNWPKPGAPDFEVTDRNRCKPTKLYQPALAFWRDQQIEYWLSVPVFNN